MKYFITVLITLFLGLLIYVSLTTVHTPRENVLELKCDTLNDTIRDTLYIYKEKLIPRKVETVRYDTIKGDTVLEINKKSYRDTLICQEDTAIVSLTTQGINVSVDSLSLELRKSNYLREITRTITVEKQPRLTFGLQVGYGIGFNSRQLEPFVGIGITYNLWRN